MSDDSKKIARDFLDEFGIALAPQEPPREYPIAHQLLGG